MTHFSASFPLAEDVTTLNLSDITFNFAVSSHLKNKQTNVKNFVRVVQFVQSLHYKSECSGFDSRWGHWDFSLT
jgi:hypothetical protein